MSISTETQTILREAVWDDDLISPSVIAQYQWSVIIMDDGNFNDPESSRFCHYLASNGCTEFFSIQAKKLNRPLKKPDLKKYSTYRPDWDQFYNIEDDIWPDYLEDCIFFSDPISFLLLKTGECRHLIYAGSKDFLEFVTGIELHNWDAVSVGNYWPDNRVEKTYRPYNMRQLPNKF